jgi:hypothetical protein
MAYYKLRLDVWCDWEQRTATSRRLLRTLVQATLFVPGAK